MEQALEMSVKDTEIWAKYLHSKINQTYGGNLEYGFHLDKVVEYGEKWIHLIEEEKREVVRKGLWLHDTLESCSSILSYNDLKRKMGVEVAEIVYAVTDEKGRTRKEKKNEKFYRELFGNKLGLFVKLADRMANVAYSKSVDSPMFYKYRREYVDLFTKCYWPPFEPMFNELEKMLT